MDAWWFRWWQLFAPPALNPEAGWGPLHRSLHPIPSHPILSQGLFSPNPLNAGRKKGLECPGDWSRTVLGFQLQSSKGCLAAHLGS